MLSNFGGVLALVDLYCMYNRARGTDLISPEDLLIACEKLNTESNSKIILRTFNSGVKVVQNSKRQYVLTYESYRGVQSRFLFLEASYFCSRKTRLDS